MARRRGGGKVIDFKTWTGIDLANSNITANGKVVGNGVSFTSQSTLLRTRGFVSASFDATQQVGDQMAITFGLAVVSADASAAGAASVPGPSGDIEYPWLWWGAMFLQSTLASGVNAWGTSAQRLEVDSKAMRRVTSLQTLLWVAEATISSGAPVTSLTFGETRVLIGT